jgi:hypothetical protein
MSIVKTTGIIGKNVSTFIIAFKRFTTQVDKKNPHPITAATILIARETLRGGARIPALIITWEKAWHWHIRKGRNSLLL